MKPTEENIHNLIDLWTTVVKPLKGSASDAKIGYSLIQASEWPNKIWSNQTLTEKTLQNIKILMASSQLNMRFIDFEFEDNKNHTLIEQAGFQHTGALTGMHLKLTKPFEIHTKLTFKMVTESLDAKIWTTIFKQSFGYVIREEIVIKNMNKIHFYIAYKAQIAVGVVKLHITNNIAGIFSLGVPSQYRGEGYAKDMMHYVLNKAIHQGAVLATLQASKLGQGMYESMGFEKDFIMNSYKLKI